MQLTSVYAAALVQALFYLPAVSGRQLEANDVPSACAVICAPIVALTGTCDAQFDDNREWNCICQNTSFNTASVSGLCASCINQNTPEREPNDDSDDDDDDNNNDIPDGREDINELMSRCSFSSTSYAPEATSVVASISSVSAATTGSTLSSSRTGTATAATTATSGVTSATGSATTTGGTQQQTGNAGHALNAHNAAGLAVAGLGAVFGAGLL